MILKVPALVTQLADVLLILVKKSQNFHECNLLTQYRSSINTDIVIRCDSGKEVYAHKCILCARSAVLKSILQEDEDIDEIEIPEFDDKTIDRMLLYMYVAVYAHDDFQSDADLLRAVSKYQIPKLPNLISKHIGASVSRGNISKVIEVLKEVRYDAIVDNCIRVIKESKTSEIDDFDEIVKDKELFAAFKEQWDTFIEEKRSMVENVEEKDENVEEKDENVEEKDENGAVPAEQDENPSSDDGS